ncbi:MAG: sensor histidine kinase [Acidimicrobiia bacterium]
MSLRARVLAGLALVAVVLVVSMVVITASTRRNLVRQVDAQLTPDLIISRIRPGGGAPAEGTVLLSQVYVGVVQGDAVTAYATPNLQGEEAPLPVIGPDRALRAARDGHAFTVGSEGSRTRYRVRAAVARPSGTVMVVALPLDDVDEAVRRLVVVELAATAAIVGVLGLVAWWVLHLGIRPVKRMTQVATAIAGGDLSSRVPPANPRTEAGELGAALNQMMGRIETSFDRQRRSEDRLRQFVADASHELRTPVSTIRGYAELYRSGGLGTPSDLDDAMRRTEQEAVRMGSLVDDLLTLARLDQGRPMEHDPVDLAVVARDAVRDAGAVDPARPITADVPAEAVVVVGDELRLRQVVANVMGNALVHTPPGTPVHVRLRAEGPHAVLEVTDQGPGMSAQDAARAFERFYRADPARARHRGGSGLGLSIVEATVGAHGGAVGLRTAPGQGTTVRFELPLAGGPAAPSVGPPVDPSPAPGPA